MAVSDKHKNGESSAGRGWLSHFTKLDGLEKATESALLKGAKVIDLPAAQSVFRNGDSCANYLLVIDGSVRVQMTAENGREIVLYRVGEGETCILTTACLMADETYSAEGITETPVKAVAVPAALFQDLLKTSEALRQFVFSTYGVRIASLMMLLEDVAFGKMDVRLARFLLEQNNPREIRATHQDLAVELGSAREVISRLLKDFERRGLVSLTRGKIAIEDRTGLECLAG